MTQNILIISVCKEPLHYYEFVKPVEDILKKHEINFITKEYDKVSKSDIEKSDKIIICGTSSLDNDFLEDISDFIDLLKSDKPIFGICAGMEIIGIILGGSIKERKEIGMSDITFYKDFLNIQKGEVLSVYHLHNFYVDFSEIRDYVDVVAVSYNIVPQAMKHKTKKIFGVLFHPEVKNKDLILEFCKS